MRLLTINTPKLLCVTAAFFLSACTAVHDKKLKADGVSEITVIADAPAGQSKSIDLGAPGISQGDLFVFEQPLINLKGDHIGTNNGYCVMTVPPTFNDCRWTLTFDDGSAIVVGGQEANSSSLPSTVPVLGGTGKYTGISGTLNSIPENGRFRQIIYYRLP